VQGRVHDRNRPAACVGSLADAAPALPRMRSPAPRRHDARLARDANVRGWGHGAASSGPVANFGDASERVSSGERERPGAARVSSPRLDSHVSQASFGSVFAIRKHLRMVRFEPLELA
jgi:hypothetical protein